MIEEGARTDRQSVSGPMSPTATSLAACSSAGALYSGSLCTRTAPSSLAQAAIQASAKDKAELRPEAGRLLEQFETVNGVTH